MKRKRKENRRRRDVEEKKDGEVEGRVGGG